MKKIILPLVIFSIIIHSKNGFGQTHHHTSHNQPNNVVTLEDIKKIKGFDEEAAIKEIKAKGIPDSEIPGMLRDKKVLFILAQRGISTEPVITMPDKSLRAGPCDNAGFEFMNFTNWQGATGTGSGAWIPGIINGPGNNAAVSDPTSQHTILTLPGLDPIAKNIVTGALEIPYLAPGGSGVSARLGNSATGAKKEQLKYAISVTPSNTSFTYQYAVVLQDPDHTVAQQPAFDIKIFDQNGVQIPGACGLYSINATNASTDTTFKKFPDPNGTSSIYEQGYYKKWTTVSIDLTPYIGTTVTIIFETKDCTAGGHFGYAYIDAGCSQLQANVNFCPNDTVLLLTAPGGFTSYQWYNNSGTAIPGPNGTNDTLVVKNPVLGQNYSVSMLAASGCGSSLSVTLGYSNMNLLQGSTNVSCYGDNDGFAYVVPSGAIPPFNYSWVESTSGSQVSTNDSLINAVAGTYYITVSSVGGCSKADTITITQPPNAGDSLDINLAFCPGDNEITLYAPPGYLGYIWYAGNNVNGTVLSTDDSLVVYNPIPGQQYFLEIVTPPPGCHLFLGTSLNYQPPSAMPDYKVKANIFSPNGDGKNDYFDLSNFKHVREFKIEIFNRWGKRVFVSYDMSVHWDGKINGNVADDGVYYWMATYKQSCYENAPSVKSTGFVHVVR